jgi:hypothetical protein
VSLTGVAGCGACEPDKSPPPVVSAATSASVAPPITVAPRPTHSQASTKLACHVLALDGTASIEDPERDGGAAPLLPQGLAPTEGWVDLDKGTRFVAKDPRTTRETTFRGPARVRACVAYAEESWVASGAFESSVGAGEAPGAEEWVITPFAVVRYAAAKLSIDVKARETDLRVESGLAFSWSPGTEVDAGPLEDGWTRRNPGTAVLSGGARGTVDRGTPVDAARLAVDRCTTLAATSRELAKVVLSPEGSADAATIATQVTTRRLARAACAIASLRVFALPRADAAPLVHPLAEANATWNALPTGP